MDPLLLFSIRDGIEWDDCCLKNPFYDFLLHCNIFDPIDEDVSWMRCKENDQRSIRCFFCRFIFISISKYLSSSESRLLDWIFHREAHEQLQTIFPLLFLLKFILVKPHIMDKRVK